MFTSTVFCTPVTRITNYCWLVLLALTAFVAPLSGQSLPAGFSNGQIQDNYNTPVGIIFSTTGQQFFVWDKSGRVWVSNWNGTTYVRQPAPVIDIREEVGDWGDGGFLSVCLDPNFSSNGLLYLFYVVDRHHLLYHGTSEYRSTANEYDDASICRVTRYRAINAGGTLTADPNSRQVLIGESKTTGIPMVYPSHVGGTLLFGRDGTLLVSTGDNAFYEGADVGSQGSTYYRKAISDGIMRSAENVGALRCQIVGSLCGKVLRINPVNGDGVPSNPFYNAGNPRAPQSRMWAMGLRNPYRMTLQSNTGGNSPDEGNPGTLLVGDVGWSTAEDFHVIDRAGLNCGWPLYEGMDQANGYYGRNIRNEDEPGRPTFESLCQQPTSPAVNPDKTQRRFTHSRPALDWQHHSPIARVPAFEGNAPTTRTIGAANAPAGVPFSGKASIGGAYYTGTQFPATYQNSYFFADFDKNWIRNIVLHDDGDHQVHEVRTFAPDGTGQGIVDLEINPLDGSLFYVNVSGQIMRISYGGNQPPVARPSADVLSGVSPLRVKFSGSNSTDPEGHPLRFRWDFGDGTSSEEANPEHIFTTADERSYTVTLTVTDKDLLTNSGQLTLSLNSIAPTARISSPADGSLYPLDRASPYTLKADVTGSNLTYEWQVSLIHNSHEHPEAVITEISPQVQISPVGCSGTDTYSYRVSLKVTNQSGLSASTSVRIYPDCQSANGVVRQVTATPLTNSVRVNWQNPTVGFEEILVAARARTGFEDNPTGTDYTADADFTGNGTAFNGGKVVYRGRAEEITVRNLTPSTPYFFRVYTRIGNAWNGGVEVTAIPTFPPTTGFAITGVNLLGCESLSAGQRRLRFTPLYSGLSGQPLSFEVLNELSPTTSPGPYSLSLYTDNPTITLKAEQGGTQVSFAYNWLAACAGEPTPPTPPANQPPVVVNSVPAQNATVGQFFSYAIAANTFSDPNNDALSLSATGLPPGLSLSNTTLSGTPTSEQTATVTLTATDPANGSVSTQFSFTVRPAPPVNNPPTTGFAITGVNLLGCESLSAGQRRLRFTPLYSGLSGQPLSFEVLNELSPTTSPGPYSLSLYTDNPTITLKAEQGGTQVSFAYNWLAACAGEPTPPTPPANQPPVVVNSVPAQNATVGQFFSYAIAANTFSDPNNDALSLSATGLPPGLSLSNTTLSGTPTSEQTATVTLTATDPANGSVSTQFSFTVRPAPPVNNPPVNNPPVNNPPTTGFAITGVNLLGCESLSAGQRRLRFTPLYSGLSGQPLSFEVLNELSPTTSPGPYSLSLYTDNPTITLKAEQGGTQVSFAYNWLATCAGSGARLGAESVERLTVQLLGNPVLTETAETEIRGEAGEWLRLQIIDGRGNHTYSETIPQAMPVERRRIRLTGPAGLYLLHVSTPTQYRVVKLLKQ